MSAAVRDQLILWQEWVDARLKDLADEVTSSEVSALKERELLRKRIPDQGDQIDRALDAASGMARLEGQREILEDSQGNLQYFLEAVDGGEDESGGGEDLEFVTQTILAAQEDERHRTSIRIHDGPAQSLANVIMRLEFCEKIAVRDGPKAAGELKDVRRELDLVLADVRRLIFDLRPMTLDDLGLLATLQRFAENEKARLPCDVQLVVTGKYQRYARTPETHIYRIVQEALRNAADHGSPYRIGIHIAITPTTLALVVDDDGAGFDVGQTRSGTGMAEIRRRVRSLDGHVRWESQPGKGCRLVVDLPLNRLGTA